MSSSTAEEETPKKEYVSPFTRNIIDTNDLNSLIKGYNHGLCGGQNLGNTCFMNSSIACLSNCTELTTYFLTKKFEKDINSENKEGLQGRLANAWYELLHDYWMSSTRTGNPSNVKSAVAKKVRKFSGYSQQDSNEFMTEFLGILSEDLNKNDLKKYEELPEKQENESDFECASRFWKLHLSLNDSIITDLFSGLLKSEVNCSNCGFHNITFDPFNTLTLAIPNSKKLLEKTKKLYDDIEFFYIPKYCIKSNMRIHLRVRKECPLNEVPEKLNSIDKFNHQIKKLVFIRVLDGKFVRFIEGTECKKEKEFVFGFDDDTDGGDGNSIIPFYMNKGKNSSFPRLLFLKDSMSFGELKKIIYFFARNHFNSPFGSEDKNELDKEIKKYKEAKKDEGYDENKLFELYNKEYEEIFNTKKGELSSFFSDFPYMITIKNKFEDSGKGMVLFDGRNNLENLKEFNISKDEDKIASLLEKNKNNFLFLMFQIKSKFIRQYIRLDSCENFEGPDYGKKEELTLDNLLEYFCSDENLEKGNEWKCSKCKKKVTVSKRFSIFFVPRILIICLNRFSRETGYFYGKNGTFIDFPLTDLDMGKYVCGPDKEYSKYDLFAVSQHFGGTEGGHYTAVCKNIDGNWYDYNDSTCSLSSAKSVKSSSAYVLFYRKQNW